MTPHDFIWQPHINGFMLDIGISIGDGLDIPLLG